MSTRNICLHQTDPTGATSIPGFKVVARTQSRQELRQAIGILDIHVLVIDLDNEGAMDAIVETLEINSSIGIVGATGNPDPKLMIAAMRTGCRQMTTKPIDVNDLSVAIRRAINDTVQQQDKGRTIAVMGAVGGAGVTTVAAYLAAGMAEVTQASTALIDCDLDFGGVARFFDINPTYTIADIASAGTIDSIMLERAAVEVAGGIHVIARPATIEQCHRIDDVTLGSTIKIARGTYSNIILDLPRRLDAVTGCAIEQADTLLVVLQLTVPAIDNARRLIQALAAVGYASDRIEVLVNRYRKNIHTISVEFVEAQLKKKVICTVPNDYQAVSASIDKGAPITARNPVRSAITELASRLMGHETEALPVKTGWLDKLSLRRKAVR